MVAINGKEYAIVCNMFVLIQFSKRIGEKNLTTALNKLSSIGGAEGIKVEGVDAWAAILFELLLAGAKKTGEALDLSLEDCYETVMDTELILEVSQVITDSMPSAEHSRNAKKKGQKKATA